MDKKLGEDASMEENKEGARERVELGGVCVLCVRERGVFIEIPYGIFLAYSWHIPGIFLAYS